MTKLNSETGQQTGPWTKFKFFEMVQTNTTFNKENMTTKKAAFNLSQKISFETSKIGIKSTNDNLNKRTLSITKV